jgi:tetratricopeptide (TPR) repeat protein
VKGLISALSAVSLALVLPLQAAQPSAAPLPAGASYHFAMAKLLAVEGSLVEALAAYEEAEKLAPEAAYVRLEHAQLLARLSQYSRNATARDNYLRKAAQQVSEAQRLAPENPDVLRAVGSIYLELAAQDATALATAQAALEAVHQRDPADVESLLTLGRLYLDQQQPDRAAQVLRDLIAQAPQQRMAYALLVEALLRAEKGEEAEAALGDILSFEPGSLEARLTLADLQGKRGDHQTAIRTLSAAPEELRQEPRLRRQLAWSLYLNGDMDEALKTVDPLLGKEASSAGQEENQGLSLLKGLILTAEGRNAEALELLDRLRQAQPEDLALAQTVARVLQREGRDKEAARVLSEVAERLAAAPGKSADAAEARLELAQVWFAAKEWDKVATALEPLLTAEEPEVRSQALLLRVDALIQAAKYDEALALLQGEKGSPLIDSKKAEILLRSGREEEGSRLLAELTAAGDPQATLTAVQALHRAERYEESIPSLEKLTAAHADRPIAGFLLGAAYERAGKREKAVAELRRVVGIAPDFHPALNYLGYTLAEAGESLDEALKLTRRAVALDPDNGSYVDSLGWVYYQLGRHEQAREYLERAARLEPRDATLQEHLGDVYVALGQKERAREAYQRAVELDDEDNVEQVRRKLDGLGGKPGA